MKAHLNSANRNIEQLGHKVMELEGKYRKMHETLKTMEKRENTFKANLEYALGVMGDRLENDDKHTKLLKEIIVQRDGLVEKNEELVRRVKEMSKSEKKLFEKVAENEKTIKEIEEQRQGAFANLRAKADAAEKLDCRPVEAEKKEKEF